MVRSVLNNSATRRCAGLLPLVVTAAVTQGLGACGKKASDAAVSTATPYSGIAIATTDYKSSVLSFQGLNNGVPTGELKALLTGESGEPWPVTLNNKLYFFNRGQDSANFRVLDPKQAGGAPTAQIRTQQAGYGDPHAVLWLSADRMLLAHWTTGKLVVVNPADGSVKQEVTATWDLGTEASAQLRPEAFYRVAGSDSQEIYVVHQGIDSNYAFDKTQQIFVLKDDGTQLTVVDVDTTKDKVQGIKLNVFNPQIIDGSVDPAKPIVAGLCTVFATISPCTSGFERVDLAARTSTMVFDRTSAAEKGNGDIVATKSGKFYAAVATVVAPQSYKTQIQVFDVGNSTAKTFYEISDANYGAYVISYDVSANRLYVGEKKADSTGQLSIFDLSTDAPTPTFLALPQPPYKVAFVP